MEHAKARGAKILAELGGFGMTSDSKDMVNPDIEGPSEAMRLALEDAELAPTDIDYLNAHGTATTINDRNETNAIKRVFGEHAYEPGHLLDQVDARPPAGRRRRHRGGGLHQGHAGQLGAADHRPRRGRTPSATSTTCPTSGRDKQVTYAMSNSFAFGGLNAVLVFGPPPA